MFRTISPVSITSTFPSVITPSTSNMRVVTRARRCLKLSMPLLFYDQLTHLPVYFLQSFLFFQYAQVFFHHSCITPLCRTRLCRLRRHAAKFGGGLLQQR